MASYTGNTGNNTKNGTNKDDTFDYSQGGHDTLNGRAGYDTFNMGAALDAHDKIDGGTGGDTLTLDGDYNLTFQASTIRNIEEINLADGHNYSLTLNDGNVAAGERLYIDAQALTATYSLNFDGSAEKDGYFLIYGGAGNDTLKGGSGDDILNGYGGADNLSGGRGADFLSTTGPNSSIDGGKGNDTADLDVHTSVTNLTFNMTSVSSTTTLVGDGTTVKNVENIIINAGSGNDTLTTGKGVDNLYGNDGGDTLTSGGGKDFLSGGTGTNTLSSDRGDDSIYSTGLDTINGGSGFDVATIDRHTAVGALTFHLGDPGTTTTLIGDGTTVKNVEKFVLTGGSGADDFRTGGADDTLNGNAGNDTLAGGAGNDTINGGADSNTLKGGHGNDYITSAGIDTIDGGPGFDNVFLDRHTSATGLTLDMQDPSQVSTMSDGSTLIHVEQISFQGGTGSDTVSGTDLNDNLRGSDGDDVFSGRGGNDTLEGDGGTNTLIGGNGNDYLNSSGVDTVKGGGGDDTAALDYHTAVAGLTFNMTDTSAVTTLVGDGTTVTDVERFDITGGSGNDNINLSGSHDDNTFDGGGGNDVLKGGSGSDTFQRSDGDDTFNGGKGYDEVDYSYAPTGVTVNLASGTVTGDGTDTLKSIEEVDGTYYNDTLIGSSQSDYFRDYSGNNTIKGGGGSDRIDANGQNTILGGSGDDDITSYGKDHIDGGSGTDFAYIDRSSSEVNLTFDMKSVASTTTIMGDGSTVKNVESMYLFGGGGNDRFTVAGHGFNELDGGDGNDHLTGGSGDDQLTGGGGNDVLNGGKGNDTASFYNPYGTHGVTANLQTGKASGGGSDKLISIENMQGTAFNDSLAGDGGNNQIYGNGGKDKLLGGGGNDYLGSYGGGGRMDGGAGRDTASIQASSDTNLTFVMKGPSAVSTLKGDGTTVTGVENIDLQGGDGNDHFTGGAGKDDLEGNGGHNVLNGGLNNDTLESDSNAVDKLDGGKGNDTAVLYKYGATTALTFHVTSASSTTKMVGEGTTVKNAENFELHGGSAADHFTTIGGTDTLDGEGGNDVLSAGGGNDFLEGGLGADRLLGGAGHDRFAYYDVAESTGTHHDRIAGFDADQDRFQLPYRITGVDHALHGAKLSQSSFDHDLQHAIGAGKLGADHAVLFTPGSGSLKGEVFLVIDANGHAGYQAGQDFVIELDNATHLSDLGKANFAVPHQQGD